MGHMEICTTPQTNNHTSTPPLSFLHAGCPSCHPTNSVKALKAVNRICNPFGKSTIQFTLSNVTEFYSLVTLVSAVWNGHKKVCGRSRTLPRQQWIRAVLLGQSSPSERRNLATCSSASASQERPCDTAYIHQHHQYSCIVWLLNYNIRTLHQYDCIN